MRGMIFMARVFVPYFYVLIPTNGVYHPNNSVFKASIGEENSTTVFKVQLVVDGKIRPRLTLSYDLESSQFELMYKAYKFLNQTYQLIPDDLKAGVKDCDITEKFNQQ